MLKSSRANLLAALRAQKIKKERKTRVKEYYAKEIERCSQAIKEAIDNGRMETFIKGLTVDYNAAADIEWYLEQYGYSACREKDLDAPSYSMSIKWYD